MSQPDNMPIARPPELPADARWDPLEAGFEWVSGAIDDEGRRHGAYRSWTRDGQLHGDSVYKNGKTHGKNVNYHPDGTIASEGDWVDDRCFDSTFYKSDAPTPEMWPASADNIRTCRFYSRTGMSNYTIKFFDGNGVEVALDGEPLPARPSGVPDSARWFGDQDRWVDGEIERGTNHQLGEWRWWDERGTLRHFEIRDAAGEPTTVINYEQDGSIDDRTVTNPDGTSTRESYFDSGKLSYRYVMDAEKREIYKGSWFGDGTLEEETIRTFDGPSNRDLTSVVERDGDGALFEATKSGDGLMCRVYSPDFDDDTPRHLIAKGMLVNRQLHGTWTLYRADGSVRRQLDTTPLGIKAGPASDEIPHALARAGFETDVGSLPVPDELHGVDDIDWASLEGAYEQEVENFPRYLRALASPDEDVRAYAAGMIEGETEHQGSTYAATAAVIPWFANLLAHPDADKSMLLVLIASYGEAAAPWAKDEDEDESGDDDDDDDGDGENPAKLVVQAIDKAWPQIWALHDSVDADDKQRILVIAKHAPTARAMLSEAAKTHDDPVMRACAIDSLTSVDDYDLDDIALALWDPDRLVRTVCAIDIALTKGPDSPTAVMPALAGAMRNWEPLEGPWRELPFSDGHVLASVALAIGSIRSSDAQSLLPELCKLIDRVDGVSAVAMGRGILALALGRGRPPYAATFIDALDTVATSKKFWVFDVNAREVLESWNLRQGLDTQSELATLVAELRASGEPASLLEARLFASDDEEDDDSDDQDDNDDGDDDDDDDDGGDDNDDNDDN